MKDKLILVFLGIFAILFMAYPFYQMSLSDAEEPKKVIENKISQNLKSELEPEKVFGKQALNLAFFGLDKTREREETIGSFRTDTIIIMHLNWQENKVYMLSIPRDTYVYVPVINRMDKINHAFPYGGGEDGNGFASSMATIENFLGIKIDHYIGLDMEAIAPLVEAAGGVTMAVDLDLDEGDCHLVKGQTQLLNGKMADLYVRYRYTGRGDIDRIQRQQRFLQAFLNQAGEKVTVEKSLQLYEKIRPMTHTDMTIPQLMALGYYFKKLDPGNIEGSLIEGSFMNKNGISYWKPNLQQQKPIIEKVFGLTKI